MGEPLANVDVWAPVRSLADLDEQKFSALLDVLNHTFLSREELIRTISELDTGLSKKQITDGLGSLIGYVAGWIGAGRVGKQPIEVQAANRAYPDSGSEVARERIRSIVVSPALMLAAGATAASMSRGHEVAGLNIGLDLTPIQWSGDPGTVVLPSFLLSFDLLNPATADVSERRSVILDLWDLRQLREHADRALTEYRSIRDSYQGAGILIWNGGEVDVDD